MTRALTLALLVVVVVALGTGADAQAPTVKIGYIPSDSFAALYIMADRYLTPGGITGLASPVSIRTRRLCSGLPAEIAAPRMPPLRSAS